MSHEACSRILSPPEKSEKRKIFDEKVPNFHHHPKTICVACTFNAIADTFNFVLDNQGEIGNIRPMPSYPRYSNNWSYSTLVSAVESSLFYLANKLIESESSEFEAYLSVARNMLERLIKIKDIINNPDLINQASNDFKNTVDDIKMIFECVDPKMIAKELKKAQFLGRGPNWDYIGDDKFKLIFAYLSRVAHTYNMDVLLSPKYDRFFIKSYFFVVLTELYHKTMSECVCLDKESINLHKKHLSSIEKIWAEKRITPENIIYCTTYYDDYRNGIEKDAIKGYCSRLDNSFNLYNKDKTCMVLPTIKFI